MPFINPTDAEIADIWRETRVIACVGASAKPARPSHFVSDYLRAFGYRVIGINPGLTGQELFGETVYASLSEVPSDIPVDMIDIFSRPAQVEAVVEQALMSLPSLRTVWMQLDITSDGVAKLAAEGDIWVVQGRCPKIEIPRLFGRGNPRHSIS